MNVRTPRGLSPASQGRTASGAADTPATGTGRSRLRRALRGVAVLAVGGLVLAGCASVPAPKVPEKKDLAGFQTQQIDWVSCRQIAKCAKVSAPMDWADLDGETIELSLAKLPAKTDEPLGTIFVNPGGPGAAGSDYVVNAAATFETLREHYDIIGWDPRGTGASSQVVCFDDRDKDEYLYGVPEDAPETGSDAWLREVRAENEKLGEACLENTGELLKHVGTQATVQDLDLMRALVGDDRLNYLGFSYGTFIGARYAETYPQLVGRLVLDGALDPTAGTQEVVVAQTKGFEQALRAYLESCLGTDKCPFTGTVDEAMAQIHDLLDDLQKRPLPSRDGRKVGTSTMLTAIVTPLYAQSMWPELSLLFKDALNGEGDVALKLADFYFDRDATGDYQSNSIEAFTAINCADYGQSSPDLAAMRRDAEELERQAPTLGAFQGYSDVGCLGWPVATESIKQPVSAKGAAPIVVIGTTGDPATPYHWAQSLAKQLDSGVLVTYEGEGHTAFGGASACIDSAVVDYFAHDEVPENGLVCK